MLHNLGYEYTCESCEDPKREEDMGPYDHLPICTDCFEAMPPEDQVKARLDWEKA